MSDEQKYKVFDAMRAGFYLVALVITVHLMIVVITVFACLYIGLEYNEMILKDPDLLSKFPQPCKDSRESIMEILATALAAALAFSGGNSIPRVPPKE